MGNGATECRWRHAPEARGGFGGFWKSQLVELSPASEEDSWLSLARVGLATGAQVLWGGVADGKSQNAKNVYLFPYVEEPLNSKVIKSFVPELRSRKCFSCFEIPMFYVYMLWTFYVRFTHSRIWLCYIAITILKQIPLALGELLWCNGLNAGLWPWSKQVRTLIAQIRTPFN